jgi:hypothetical protein
MSIPIYFISTTMHIRKMVVDVSQYSLNTTTKKNAVVNAIISLNK